MPQKPPLAAALIPGQIRHLLLQTLGTITTHQQEQQTTLVLMPSISHSLRQQNKALLSRQPHPSGVSLEGRERWEMIQGLGIIAPLGSMV